MTHPERAGTAGIGFFHRRLVIVTLGGLGLTAGGCSSPNAGMEVDSDSASFATDNGIKVRNGLTEANGLKVRNGLSTIATSAGLLNTVEGLSELSYLVKCALPAGHTLVRTDAAGVKHSFPGSIGLAPEWEQNTCGQTCQEWVSACVLSLVNSTGKHVPVWMVAEAPALGFGLNAAYPHQEGSFFGNIFLNPPVAYYCGGRDYAVSPVKGRIGSAESDPTQYVDIYGSGGRCAAHCTPSDYPNAMDGFKACSGWNHVVTIWRN